MPDNVLVERHERVALVRLNRDYALNALNSELLTDMISSMEPLDRDPSVGCFVIAGNQKSFAAGADISEMAPKSFGAMYQEDFFAGWDRFTAFRTPKIAAVAGYALGGGCELAMMCDMIFASDKARFGQPEIKLGVIPGIGGSQRLTKLVGKAVAMDLILTGRMMDADEALRTGLVSRVVPVDDLETEALAAARVIAGYSKPAVMMAKEVVDHAESSGLHEGIRFERRVFHSLFATDDQKEGMNAFLAKRSANFTGT
jgi:enoyl-CoA hydratase